MKRSGTGPEEVRTKCAPSSSMRSVTTAASRRQERHGRMRLLSLKKPALTPHAPIRQHGVEAAELAHGHFRAAEYQTEAVVLLAEGELHARPLQKGKQPGPQL